MKNHPNKNKEQQSTSGLKTKEKNPLHTQYNRKLHKAKKKQ
jgi:hypothetical protein